MLACARIGAAHSRDLRRLLRRGARRPRSTTPGARCIITADGGWRRGKIVPLKSNVDEALERVADRQDASSCSTRTGHAVDDEARPRPSGGTSLVDAAADRLPGRAAGQRAPALHPLHLRLHRQAQGHPAHHRRLPGRHVADAPSTSSTSRTTTSTGAPPTSAGSPATATSSTGRWPTARPADVRGRARTCPTRTASGRSIEKYGVTIFYTAPTAIRAFMKWGDELPGKHDLSSLRLLGTVGEPINPEAWMWYQRDHRRRAAARSSTPGGRPRPARS